MPQSYHQLFDNNVKWVDQMNQEDPDFFHRLANGQSPNFLWIGCADSRVPANQITGTAPGDVFVHRNIANMVIHTDMSMLSVLDYSVNVLGVKHIIVCGHYGCGGVNAAMGNKSVGLIDNWLRHIKDVYRLHREELDAIEDMTARSNRFVELNVIEQSLDLCKTSIVQNAWKQGQFLEIHGIVYDVANGLLKDLNVPTSSTKDMEQVYILDPKGAA
ncbi:carbonate dehydratase [Salmonirosea aquatica]|uniref:Carbonic anhydrase 2 n=1 Tax=Salmonirosea aquatica TaxID=2654236 RepID=A0A7C9FB71_9BACT|nr:carbonate dehydratase [Cytophagaceae bacterium SJW1-29]